MFNHNEPWVEQFLRIELQQNWKETSGKYSGKVWTRRIEKCLIKCSLIQDCTIQRVVMLAVLYWFIRFFSPVLMQECIRNTFYQL